MNKKYYPVAFLLLIGIAAFITYSGILVPKIDLQQYKSVCIKYRTAAVGTYTNNQMQGLINKINYLFPQAVSDIKDPLKKEIKTCANELATHIKK